MGSCASNVPQDAGDLSTQTKTINELDVRNAPGWDEQNVWVCDIDSNKKGLDLDFLFVGDMNDDGTMEDNSHKNWGRIVLQNDMYDIQKFIPDKEYDGELNFRIEFGANTKRGTYCVKGWFAEFKGLKRNDKGNYVGTIVTDSWRSGAAPDTEKVTLLHYPSLNAEQRRKFPDLVVRRYWKSEL